MYIYLIFPHGVSYLDHKQLNKGGLLSYFHSESNFTWGKTGLTWCTWVHLMIIGQMTKKWCNRFPPSIRVLGANLMTKVDCKNSITRQRRGIQRERSIRQTKVLKELDLEEARLTDEKSLFDELSTCAIGGGGGIPMPSEEKYKK